MTRLATFVRRALLVAAVILVLAFTLAPLAWMILGSLKPGLAAQAYPPVFLFEPTLDHYREVFGNADSIPIARAFLNSTLAMGISTILTLVIACPAAYSLARLKPRGSRAMTIAIIAVRMLPPIVLVVPLFQFVQPLGLQDSLVSLVLPYTALSIPLAVWMLYGFFLDLPKELEEAAMMDGCTRLSAMRHVILPIAAPGIAATAIFTGLLAWNDLVFALPLTTIDAITLPVVASRMRVEEGVLWGQLGAVMTIMILPVVVLTFFVQRHIVHGIGAGSVKG